MGYFSWCNAQNKKGKGGWALVKRELGEQSLLCGRLVGENDTLGDVVLQATDGLLQQLLLLLGNVAEDINGLLGTVGL